MQYIRGGGGGKNTMTYNKKQSKKEKNAQQSIEYRTNVQ